MKKKVLWILMLCLVIVLAMALVACGSKTSTSTDNGTETTTGDQGGSSGGQSGGGSGNSGGGQGGGSGSGSGSGGGSGSGSSGQSGGGTSNSLTLPTRDAILASIDLSLYKISASNLSGDVVTTVAYDGDYYYHANPNPVFAKLIGDYAYQYGKNSSSNKYTALRSPTTIANILGLGNVGSLFLYAGETITYESMEAITFIGRPAKQYTCTSTDPGNNVHTEILIIDDATGVCLKHDSSYVLTDSFVGGAQRVSFAVTELEYGAGNTVARNFLDTFINNIDVYTWDTVYMTQAGLTAVAAPSSTWTFWSAQFDHNTNRTSVAPDLDTFYHYYTSDVEGTKDAINTFIQSFYNAGANKDEYGANQTFNDLCYYDTDDSSYDFTGYTNLGYKVFISARNSSSVTPRNWNIEIQIYIED